jgi:hypothetical protein
MIPAAAGLWLLAFTRPAYLFVCVLDLAALLLFRKRLKGRRHSVYLAGVLMLAALIAVFLMTRSDSSIYAGIINTGGMQASLGSLGSSTTTSTAIGGRLASLSGLGVVVAIPVRLVISILAPFPWTSTAVFYAPLGGFNGSAVALTFHIVISIIALSALVLMAIRLWDTRKRCGLKGVLENTNLPICTALLFAACVTETGYNRYVAISYPFVAAAILYPSQAPMDARRLRHQLYTAGTISVIGTMCLVAIYTIRP